MSNTLDDTARIGNSFVSAWLVACVFLLAACGQASESANQDEPDDEAVELWTHPDSVGIEIYSPADLKAESRDVAWGVDRIAGAIMRFEPGSGRFGVFGFLGSEPVQVAAPMRLAVSQSAGVITFDDSTGMVDFYTPGGQHVRGFDPGFRPSILELASSPLRLTFGVSALDADSVPRLTVIQTDFLGRSRDTLLAPGIGPVAVQNMVARGGMMMVSPSESGLWLFSREVPDTVFEISARDPGRKLALPESDPKRVGVIADLEEQLLWVVVPRAEGGLDYEAFDVSSAEPGQVLELGPHYLGARKTPLGFVGKVAVDGSIAGWWNVKGAQVVPRSYDMRVDDLREGVDEAQAGRDARRRLNDTNWELRLEEEARQREEEAGEPTEEPTEE